MNKMKQSIKKIILVFSIMIISIIVAKAQNNPMNKKSSNLSYGKLSLSYLSNNVYNGRKDSLTQPYITTTLGYYDQSGFYINAGFSYLNASSEKRIDLFSLDAGYEFTINDQFTGSVFANKSFYNGSSIVISSDIKGSLGFDLNYNLGLFNAFGGAEMLFSNKKDITTNIGLSHDFEWGKEESKWTVSPSALINFSSLNFYEGYSTKKANKRTQAIVPNLVSSTITTRVDNPGFTLLDYELLIPITYETKNWGCFLNTTLAIPTNVINTTTTTVTKFNNGSDIINKTDSTPLSEKTLQNTFYVELGIHFKF